MSGLTFFITSFLIFIINIIILALTNSYAYMLSCTVLSVACHAPLSMEFSRQEYWSGLPFPPTEDLPDPGIRPKSPALAEGSFTSEPPAHLLLKRTGEIMTKT